MKLFLTIFLCFLFITTCSEACNSGMSIIDSQCFNEILYLDQENKYYRAGHFAMNTKGDMIIEYSYLQYRLFYGLKNNGKLFFPEVTKEIELQNDDNHHNVNPEYIRRYESINSYISLIDDINKEREYLLSISSYRTVLELYDFENENETYSLYDAINLFNNDDGIYSFIFQILEAKIDNNNTYFCVYMTREGTYYNNYNYRIFVKKLGFSNFNFNLVEVSQNLITYEQGSRILSSIIIDYYNLLAVFYLEENNYVSLFYDYNLVKKGEQRDFAEISGTFKGNGIFFKAYYLYGQFIAFFYYMNLDRFQLKIMNMDNDYSFHMINYYDSNSLIQDSYGNTMNEFLKIDNHRFVLLAISYESSSSNYGRQLFIVFFDFFDSLNSDEHYKYIKVRYYSYDFYNEKISKFAKEISAFIFNDFLVFTSTALPRDANSNSDNFFPILLMFGYPNGTDFEIDVFPYLMDTGSYSGSNNLIYYLMESMEIFNNIFGYERVPQIRLASIPDEIIFLNGTDNSKLSNNDTIDENYLLKQNLDIIKDNKYYYLDYQFIVKEPDYDTFYSNTYSSLIDGDTDDLSYLFVPKILYGRTNTLKFKLCHKFCKTCRVMGINDNDQKCDSCLKEYSFNNNAETNSECVAGGYFFDSETKSMIECTKENSKFYTNITDNRTICFKNNYDCPIDYQDYNQTTGECKFKKIIIPTTLTTTIVKTEIDTIPVTIKETEAETEKEIVSQSDKNIIKKSSFIVTSLNQDINRKIDDELIKNYTVGDDSIEIKGENNSIFQLTTTNNELKRFSGNLLNNNNLSIIDLGNCETTLKSFYRINSNLSLIIKKFEQITIASERNVQYEVYHPTTKEKLNLSLCDSDTIDLYIPIRLDEKLLELYEDLQNSGYDLFNINDPFYNDLCSPYKSKDGTDVLLSDRKNDYYNNNYTTCQSNCEYSSFNSEYKFLKCECKVVVDDTDIHDFDKFSKKIYKNFYDILKNSNYKTLKCYKLVFNPNYLKKNIGSFIVLGFFVGYLCFLGIVIYKGISPLQEEVMKNIQIPNIIDINKNINENEKKDIIEFPPKKRKTVMIESDLSLQKENTKKRKSMKIKKTKTTNYNKVNPISQEKSTINDKNQMISQTKGVLDEKNILKKTKTKRKSKVIFKNIRSNEKNDINNIIKINDTEKLDDLDLNNLTYDKALELDKRTLIQIYWNRLKKKHLIIYTFFATNDHNLIYIKLSRFFFLVCTNMAMNVIFFFDSSMHKIYLDYGKYNFIQQIPQIIYSSIISVVIEVLIGILSFTDKNIYQIRQLKESNTEKINEIFKTIKIKLITYFVITFIFFLFYWYLISSFCAVYNNTQIIYIKDFITSFCLSLIYPFVIQLCFSLVRIFSLRDNTKFRSLLYKIC